MLLKGAEASVDSMEELFKVLDVDNSGRVSRMELLGSS